MKKLAIVITALLICSTTTDGGPITEWSVPISETDFTGRMAKYETTNAQYCEFLNYAFASKDITVSGSDVLGANGSNGGADYIDKLYYDIAGSGYNGHEGTARINFIDDVFSVDNGFEDHPVTYTSWYGATAFCNYYGYSLPTKEQWEAVADFDGTYNYGCGIDINNSKANYADYIYHDGTTVVCNYGEYGYGMCDMAGNAKEWTNSTEGEYQILKGGGFRHAAPGCMVISDDYNYKSDVHYNTGFRVIPEPATLLLFGIGGLMLRRRKK